MEQAVDLLSPTLTHAEYRRLLERFLGFYEPVEQRLGAFREWPDIGVDLQARSKLAQLDADLRALGCADASALPRATVLPGLDTIDEALGCAYVLEGATLGGQIISRQLRQVLAVTPDSGGRFFAGYGDDTGSMWRTFGAALTAYVDAHGNADRVVLGARQTFETFRRWLDGGRRE